MDVISLIYGKIHQFILIFLRVGSIIVLAPIFGSRNIPVQLKVGFALILSVMLVPVVPVGDISGITLSGLVTLVAKELVVGMFFGLVTMLVFVGIQMAGRIIGMQIGFGIVNVIDPQSQTQVSIIGQFKYMIAILLLLSFHGHHFILQGMVESFRLFPADSVVFPRIGSSRFLYVTSEIFSIAIKIGAPVFVTMFMVSVGLGLIARTVPQMNVFIVGFPLKIGVGLLAIIYSLPVFAAVFHALWDEMTRNLLILVKAMGS
jgi:flagellar biosynthetic protein FliR